MGPSFVECPYDSEVWTCNTGYYKIAQRQGHLNKVFIAHTQVKRGDKVVFDWNHFNQFKELGVETLSLHKIEGLDATIYPIRYIAKKFRCDYFSDTICYMLAYALHQATRPTKKPPYVELKYPFLIKLYGVDMREIGEYGYEKGGVEYWMGFMRGLGVEFENTSLSTLLKTVTYKPYGLSDFDHNKTFKGAQVIAGLKEEIINGKRAYRELRRSDYSSRNT